jgi:hypothetical protein
MTRTLRAATLLTASVVVLSVAGCAEPTASAPSAQPTSTPGAAELAAQPLGWTTIDEAGTVTHRDLTEGTEVEISKLDEPASAHSDGRYLFAQEAGGVAVIDSGVWTWDHDDHVHYYRAEPRALGTVEGAGAAQVVTTNSSTTGGIGIFFSRSGEAVLLDAASLSRGERKESFRVRTQPHEGLVVPIGRFALVTEAESATTGSTAIVALTGEGRHVSGVAEPCRNAAGAITTAVGAVIGCEHGAVLATSDAGELTLESIPYPRNTTAARATAFAGREGRPTVAGLSGSDAVWMLDTRERTWTLVGAPRPLTAVSALGDADDTLVGVTDDGRVMAIDARSGTELTITEPLVAHSLGRAASPTLTLVGERAYLSAPVERRLYEIELDGDDMAVDSVDTTTEPRLAAVTGR